ncbi:ribosome small subunit-dependent GTPase A [Candidatus Clostridium radicumherbarum]|uniref:Small ribosomal subunit biogenesis GTPase RsgA n=1 Tax=Candidatus Clostridium radicumherbarum TaxID=3381662 RepID=A0ABW8TR62_9CLOT
MNGTIVKGIGGFYYIKTQDEIIECKARGKFRFNELTPMVGDKVEITVKNNKGVIERIFERSSELIRPSVANVSQAFVVFTFKNPELNLELLNKFLLQCEKNNLRVVICFNKIDLVDLKEYEHIFHMFNNAGYECIYLNAKSGIGLDLLKEKLTNNITVFCGPSGVGKSTLCNKLIGRELMETGNISEKSSRGKHTTRHSELIECKDGFIVDTPGFSSLEIIDIEKEKLQNYFPEFKVYKDTCKFSGCLHYKEPSCSVKEAVNENKINELRYNFYVKTLEELMRGRIKR